MAACSGALWASLAPGAEETVRFTLTPRDLSVWTGGEGDGWARASGAFGVAVGSSSRDIRLRAELRLAE